MLAHFVASTAFATALIAPAAAFDIKNLTASGASPALVAPSEIAINGADKRLIFKIMDETLGYGALLNAFPSGRKAVEQGGASDLIIGLEGLTLGTLRGAVNRTAVLDAGKLLDPPQFPNLLRLDIKKLGTSSSSIFGISISGVPPLTHFYSGQNAQTSLAIDASAGSSSLAEQTGMFIMSSTIGQAGGLAAYKMALGAESICGPGSAPCWGMTTVLTTLAGYSPSNIQVAHEFDQNNNSGVDCADQDAGVSVVGLCGTVFLTGAGANQLTFGIGISGYSKIRNGIQFNSGGPIAASLRDYSSSQVAYKDTGQHVNGFDGSAATYSGKAITTPGFSVDGAGNVVSAMTISSIIQANGAFRGPFGTPTSASSACVPGQIQIDAEFIYSCVARNSWHRVSNGSAW